MGTFRAHGAIVLAGLVALGGCQSGSSWSLWGKKDAPATAVADKKPAVPPTPSSQSSPMLGATAGARTGTGSTMAPSFNPNGTAGAPGGAVPAAYQAPVGGQSALGSLGAPPAGRSAAGAGVASSSDPFMQRGAYPSSSGTTMGAARTSMPATPGAYPSTGAPGGYNPSASMQNPYASTQGMAGMSGPSGMSGMSGGMPSGTARMGATQDYNMPNDRINVASRPGIGADPSRTMPPANPGFGGYNPSASSASRSAAGAGDPFGRPKSSEYPAPPSGPMASAGPLSSPPPPADPYATPSRSSTGSRPSGLGAPSSSGMNYPSGGYPSSTNSQGGYPSNTGYQGGGYPNSSPSSGGYPNNYGRGSDGVPSASNSLPRNDTSSGLRQGYSSSREPRIPGDTGYPRGTGYNPPSAPAAPDADAGYMPTGLRDTGRAPSASSSYRMPPTPSLDSNDSGISPTSYLDASSSTNVRR